MSKKGSHSEHGSLSSRDQLNKNDTKPTQINSSETSSLCQQNTSKRCSYSGRDAEQYIYQWDEIGSKHPKTCQLLKKNSKTPFPQLPQEEDRYDKNGLPTKEYQKKLSEVVQYYDEWLSREVEQKNSSNIICLIDQMYKTEFRYTEWCHIEKIIKTLESVPKKITNVEVVEKCSTMKQYLNAYVD